MNNKAIPNVTELLHKWNKGDQEAFNQVVSLVYDELGRIAHRRLCCERPGHLIQTTALVHEAYLQLIGANQVNWRDRAHFFAIAAQVMRRVLILEARKRNRQKRAGGMTMIPLEDSLAITGWREIDLLALDEALEWLARLAPRKSQVVELRFFGGLTIEETAAALHVSVDTVKNDWATAKLWLMRRLSGEEVQNGSAAIRKD